MGETCPYTYLRAAPKGAAFRFMDRLEQKKILTERLKTVVQRYQDLLPEERSIAGIKDISRKLGEFITTPASSTAWDYDSLLKLDGPALFRKISGAWGAGQRTNNGMMIVQPGASKKKVVSPFDGSEKLKDIAPGNRVHHKVQIASVYRSIEHLPTDRQLELIEALADRAYMIGNDPSNLESLLDYTHEYAGDNAAHVWGDTKGAHFRANISEDMPFEHQLDALIETSVKPQYRDILRATSPGTVEYAVRKKQATDFFNITGKSIDQASAADYKTFNSWLNERKDLPFALRDSYDESLVDDKNKSTYSTYLDHYSNVAAGRRSSGLAPLKGPERRALDAQLSKAREQLVDPKAYLAQFNAGIIPTTLRGKEAQSLVQQARQALAIKTGYPAQYGAGLGTEAYGQLKNHLRSNWRGALAGGVNRDVGMQIGQGNYTNAASNLAQDIAIGSAVESGIKTVLSHPISRSVASGVAKRLPAAATRFAAGSAGTGGALMPAMAAYAAYDLADGVVEGATGKGITQRVAPHVQSGVKAAVKAAPALINKAQAVNRNLNPVGHRINNEVQYFITNPIKSAFSKVFGNRGT